MEVAWHLKAFLHLSTTSMSFEISITLPSANGCSAKNMGVQETWCTRLNAPACAYRKFNFCESHILHTCQYLATLTKDIMVHCELSRDSLSDMTISNLRWCWRCDERPFCLSELAYAVKAHWWTLSSRSRLPRWRLGPTTEHAKAY